MANICTNMFYMNSTDEKNLEYVTKFIDENFYIEDSNQDGENLDILFESKWSFPEEAMEDMLDNLPNKEEYYMRCLSYEFGCNYHDLAYADENTEGWVYV